MFLSSLLMLLSFLIIITLNSTSDNSLKSISFILSSVEFPCSFTLDLFVSPFWLSQWILEPAKFSMWVLVFYCLWLPLLGLCERTHVKHHCQVLLSWVDLQAQQRFSYPLAFVCRLLVSVT
uniref:Uncharacterized protein n=1 Tax=Molossus molossus TaxID=27622 RepID=A0A7J8FZ58_MOLMO|nr:hypothetical protein HJG59_008256 [Molossus molossus]